MNKSVGLRLRSQSGQGLVEYVLLLVVVVTIALAFMNLFFKPYKKWAENYIGSYVACMLDQGQLPSLGGASGIQDCDPATADFGGGGGGKSGSRSRDEASKDNRDTDGRGGQDSAGRGGGNTLVSRDGGNFKRVSLGADGATASPKSISLGSDDRQSSSGYYNITQRDRTIRSTGNRRDGGAFLSGMLEAEKEKIKKREHKVQKVSSGGEEATRQAAKKFAVEAKERKPAEVDLSDGDWSFGKLFRFLLILVIIIALVLFICGQVVQISKGMEK